MVDMKHRHGREEPHEHGSTGNCSHFHNKEEEVQCVVTIHSSMYYPLSKLLDRPEVKQALKEQE